MLPGFQFQFLRLDGSIHSPIIPWYGRIYVKIYVSSGYHNTIFVRLSRYPPSQHGTLKQYFSNVGPAS